MQLRLNLFLNLTLFSVLGAVISSGHDPMLVMEYMEYGSLYDLLHSETMFFTGDINLQVSCYEFPSVLLGRCCVFLFGLSLTWHP